MWEHADIVVADGNILRTVVVGLIWYMNTNSVEQIFVNTLEQPAKCCQTVFRLLQSLPFHLDLRLILCKTYLRNWQHIGSPISVLEYAFLQPQYHCSEKVNVADFTEFFTESGAYETSLSGFKAVAGIVAQLPATVGTTNKTRDIGLTCSVR